MEYNHILFSIENKIAKITFNNPDKLNSFNFEMAEEVQNALDKCNIDENIRAVIITGSGKAFSAGQDLKEAISGKYQVEHIVDHHYNPIIIKIRQLAKPVIAAVNGVAAGAGANIALACDIVIANENAKFIQAFSSIGLIPDSGGTYFLPRLIGMQKASALMMLGDKITAEEAEKTGMIYKVFPENEFDEQLMNIASKLAKMPTRALYLTKQALNSSFNNDLRIQLDYEKYLQQKASSSHDYNEGVKAFIEKRKPDFTGK